MAKLLESFPDPAKFSKEEEFIYAAKISSVFKKVVGEILQWVEGNVEQAQYLEKKKNGEITDPFSIGR